MEQDFTPGPKDTLTTPELTNDEIQGRLINYIDARRSGREPGSITQEDLSKPVSEDTETAVFDFIGKGGGTDYLQEITLTQPTNTEKPIAGLYDQIVAVDDPNQRWATNVLISYMGTTNKGATPGATPQGLQNLISNYPDAISFSKKPMATDIAALAIAQKREVPDSAITQAVAKVGETLYGTQSRFWTEAQKLKEISGR